jgi:ribosome-binding factor A
MRIRPERVAQMIRREIAEILEHRLRDPRLGSLISVTDVEVTPDLSLARVYVSVLADEPARERMFAILASASGFVRRELTPRLGLREIPEIRFLLDTSIDRGARVEELLRRLNQGEAIPDDEERE